MGAPGEFFIETVEGPAIAQGTIRWVQPVYDAKTDRKCFQLCTNARGCVPDPKVLFDKWRVCMGHSPRSYQAIADRLVRS